MILTLNREEIKQLVQKHIQHLGLDRGLSHSSDDDQTLEIELGFVAGDFAVVAAINEPLNPDLFDADDFQPECALRDASGDADDQDSTTANDAADDSDSESDSQPAKRKRKRRTRAEIEAAEKAAAAEQQEQAGETVEPLAEAKSAEAETPDENLFAPTESEAESTPVAEAEASADEEAPFDTDDEADNDLFVTEPVAGDPLTDPGETSIFGSAEPEPEAEVEHTAGASDPFGSDENLFAEAPAEDKPVTKTEDGFVQPSDDDDALNLFA